MQRLLKQFAHLFLILVLTACATSNQGSPLLESEPAAGSTQSRAPRTLRLFFSALPDVDQSSLSLTGPAGEHSLRGLHTMAADDLMIEILDPLTPGEYTVNWATVVEGDPTRHEGIFTFTVTP